MLGRKSTAMSIMDRDSWSIVGSIMTEILLGYDLESILGNSRSMFWWCVGMHLHSYLRAGSSESHSSLVIRYSTSPSSIPGGGSSYLL